MQGFIFLAQLLTYAMQAAAKVARRQKQRRQTEPLDPLDEPDGAAAASSREGKPVRQKRAHPLDPFDGDVNMEPAKESKGQRKKRTKRMKGGAPMEVEEDGEAQRGEDAGVGHRHLLSGLGRMVQLHFMVPPQSAGRGKGGAEVE